jgi:PAS domain S-box-containing protein
MNQLPNLLIVDDIKANLLLLRSVTKKLELNLIEASSGSEALEKTQGMELALAIIDVRMPEMDGYELAMKLNGGRQEDKVPVIFLTANYFNEIEVFKGYDSGAADYIIKPINSRILLSKINIFLDLFNQKQTIKENALLLKKTADELIHTNSALLEREENLLQEQLFTKALLNSIPGIFYLYSYPEMKMVTWNKNHETIFGYDAKELNGVSIEAFHLPENRQSVLDQEEIFLKGDQLSIEAPLVTKDGRLIPFLLTGAKFESNGKKYLMGVGTDITDRKRTEMELQLSYEKLQQLSQYTEKARESERKMIARELHDELGQALTSVKIDLSIIKQHISDDKVNLRIDKMSDLVSETIETIQRITSQLRPEIIDDLGLNAAIKWYTKEFAERNGIEIFLDMDSEIAISPDDSLALFRIMQESLTNVARHSKANHVVIKLIHENGIVNFRISDNGIGISDNEINAKKSFGIIGIKERASSLTGTCEIYSENGHGTIINLIFPLNKKWGYEDSDLR